MGFTWKKARENIVFDFIYDSLRLIVVVLVVPFIYKLASTIFPALQQLITTQNLSIILAITVTVLLIVRGISSWGKNIFSIYKNLGVFYFKPNESAKDQTNNKAFLQDQCKKAKDVLIIGATGYRTFARADDEDTAPLRDVFTKDVTGDIKILLLCPRATGTINRANALGVPIDTYYEEIRRSIEFLSELRGMGKNVALKFYTQIPIWKMIILDNFLWLQYYHPNTHVHRMPVYGISRASNNRESLFEPLYNVFLKKWRHDDSPVYDFDTDEIVFSDRREPLII